MLSLRICKNVAFVFFSPSWLMMLRVIWCDYKLIVLFNVNNRSSVVGFPHFLKIFPNDEVEARSGQLFIAHLWSTRICLRIGEKSCFTFCRLHANGEINTGLLLFATSFPAQVLCICFHSILLNSSSWWLFPETCVWFAALSCVVLKPLFVQPSFSGKVHACSLNNLGSLNTIFH